jgi:hypothetical protein
LFCRLPEELHRLLVVVLAHLEKRRQAQSLVGIGVARQQVAGQPFHLFQQPVVLLLGYRVSCQVNVRQLAGRILFVRHQFHRSAIRADGGMRLSAAPLGVTEFGVGLPELGVALDGVLVHDHRFFVLALREVLVAVLDVTALHLLGIT